MTKYITLKDVAVLAGTTASTVSYVLSNKSGRYISEETKKKVLDAAKELDYIKCNGASSLKGKERKLVGILIPQFENQFFTRIAVAAQSIFIEQGYDLLISNTLDNPKREKAILYRFMQQRVDGIIITPTIMGTENTETLRRVGVNMVVVDRPLEGLDSYFWVTTNNYGCGKVGAEHLLSMGHTRIGYIGWNSGIRDLDARCRAVLEVYRAAGLEENVVVAEGAFSAEEGYRMTAELLDEHPDVTALFYGFNMQAIGGIRCLMDRKLHIPDDISVILIGTPEWAFSGQNNFTRIDMGDMELGRKAAQLLLDLIQGREQSVAKRIIQDCSLVEGTSVKRIH